MEQRKIGFAKRFLPLILTLIYILISYLMYRFGCFVWPFRTDIMTLIFIVFCMLALAIGYFLSIKNVKIYGGESDVATKIRIEKVLILAFIVSVVVFLPTSKAYTDSWWPPVVRALVDPKGTYYSLAEIALNRTSLRIWGFLDVFPFALLPLTLWGWEDIRKWIRTSALVLAVGYLAIYVSSARNIAVVTQMLSVLAVWLSVLCTKKNGISKKRIWRISLLSVAYIVLVIVFFGMTMRARTGYNESVYVALRDSLAEHNEDLGEHNENSDEHNTIGNVGSDVTNDDSEKINKLLEEFNETTEIFNAAGNVQIVGIGTAEYNGLSITREQLEQFIQVYTLFPNYADVWSKAYVDIDSFFVKNLPASLSNLYVMGTGYITNGYNCLTVALHSDFQWTYGVGHSAFLSTYIDKFLHTKITERAYYNRLTNDKEYPLVSKSHWPSTFVQMADDLTFVGVVFFMVLIGFCVAKIWGSILLFENYWGVLLLGQVMLGILFWPANNILENSGGLFVTFWSLFIMWLLTQKKSHRGSINEIGKQ